MNKNDWLNKLKQNKELLHNFIRSYHPTYLRPNKEGSIMDDSITAPNAEVACELIRGIIRTDWQDMPNPTDVFDLAIQTEDTGMLENLLNSAWFGVPESTACWQIPGFKEVVDLLEDPVDYE